MSYDPNSSLHFSPRVERSTCWSDIIALDFGLIFKNMENIVEIKELIFDESGKVTETDDRQIICRVLLDNGKENIAAVSKEFLPEFGITICDANAAEVSSNLGDRLVSCNTESNTASSTDWSDESTRLVLDKYEQYLPQVGPMKKFKNKKNMWETISTDLKSQNFVKSALQCENRYKTILKIKRHVNINNNTSGSKRIKVDFEDEIKKIAAIDDSVEPGVMLSAQQCIVNSKCQKEKIKKVHVAKESVHELALRIHKEKEDNKRQRHEEKMTFLQNFAEILSKNTKLT